MKRTLLHLAFWIVYLSQDILLIYFLNTTRFTLSRGAEFLLAIENCIVLLLPKLAFTYFMLYFVLNRIVRVGINKKVFILSILALTGSLFLYRGLVVFFINPSINKVTDNLPFFYPLGFLVGLMDIGFASGAAITLKQIRLQLSAKEHEKNLIRGKLETELKFLRTQIHPHFLFNTLNNLYALSRKKSDETPEVVMRLSKLLRFMLYETSKASIKIGDEVKMLSDYIELEKIRYGSRLKITFLKEIDNDNELISPLLLLPFVENAFKHGASESCTESFIHIDMKLKTGILNFNIDNSNENYQSNEISENIGLKNVKRQLELMYKEYNVHLNSDPSIFQVWLTINLKSNAEI